MSPHADAELLGLARGKQSGPVESGAASREIDVVSLLAHLAGSGTKHLDDPGREVLDMLCRKISVAKQVCRSYRDDWKKAPEPEPLGARGWSLLIAVLLERAETAVADESELAFAVKYLNAALEALDLADTFEEEVLDRARLRVRAEAILESLSTWAGAEER